MRFKANIPWIIAVAFAFIAAALFVGTRNRSNLLSAEIDRLKLENVSLRQTSARNASLLSELRRNVSAQTPSQLPNVPIPSVGTGTSTPILAQAKNAQRSAQRSFGYIFSYMPELDRDTQGKLKELLARKQVLETDVAMEASSRRLSRTSSEYAALLADRTASAESDIQALLGERYGEYQELASLRGAIWLINPNNGTLGLDMEYYGVPLSSDAMLQMARVMREINYIQDDPALPPLLLEPVDPETGLKPIIASLISKSSGFLTQAQIDVIKDWNSELVARQASESQK